MKIYDLMDENGDKEYRKRVQELKEGGGPASFTASHRRKDGTFVDIEVNAKIVSVPSGKYIVGIGKDITYSKLATMLNMAMEEISRKLMARSNINDTLASVINIGREAIGAESVILGLVQGDDLVISHVDGIPWLRPGTLMRIEDDRISSNVIRTGRPMMCNGISENELSGTAKKLSARSRIVVPIRMAETDPRNAIVQHTYKFWTVQRCSSRFR